jgi:hypothetical protein
MPLRKMVYGIYPVEVTGQRDGPIYDHIGSRHSKRQKRSNEFTQIILRLTQNRGKLSDLFGAQKITENEETRITEELSKGWKRASSSSQKDSVPSRHRILASLASKATGKQQVRRNAKPSIALDPATIVLITLQNLSCFFFARSNVARTLGTVKTDFRIISENKNILSTFAGE